MRSTEQLNLLSEQSYWVDRGKKNVEYHPKEDEYYYYNYKDRSLGQFKVLKVSDNQINGMQAMAVAPVINGQVDHNNITIAYAGTNFGDANDREADIKSVIMGINSASERVHIGASSISVPVSSQVDTALDFAAEIQKTYPQANISTTGHSLGGYLASFVAIKNRWSTTVFNGPSPDNMLTEDEITWAKANTDILVNYRNSKDKIGNFGSDPLGIARYVEPYVDTGFFDLLTYHGLSTWQFDDHGNLVDKYGLIVDKQNYQTSVDVDSDGLVDIALTQSNIKPRNLFLSSGSIDLTGSKAIKVNSDSLRMLSSNLNLLALNEIPAIIRLCQLCQEKNSKIQGDFETRKQKVEESIVQRFKETRLTELFYQLHDSIGQIIGKNTIFDNLSSPSTLVNTISDPAYFETGAYLELFPYNSMLTTLAGQSRALAQHATEERTGGYQTGLLINPTPTALKSSRVLEETAKHLKEKSKEIFEGAGLREGKRDGISESLNEVLEVEQKNLSQLKLAVENVAQLTLSLANNFKSMDEWLGSQISSGEKMEGPIGQNVPTSYKAYLEESGVFDDVNNVLQAFDEQVEKNSDIYAQEVASAFAEAFQQVQSSLEKWSSQMMNFHKTVDAIEDSFDMKIYVDQTKTVDRRIVTTRTYWGQLIRLYGATTSANVRSAQSELKSLSDKVASALEVSRHAKNDMQHLKPQLKTIIEEGVYVAFDLDEIVASHKVIQSLTGRIKMELTYVTNTISSQMTGRAVTTLSERLGNVHQLMGCFNQLVGDCFGDQSGSDASVPSGVLSPQARKFSLNKRR